ncbi:N(2)-acetyl-L-2,4-diaminobutanoate deacetylase DoeB2 [Vibrio stylophorae]|uniref:N(2)-acetyl-L-2,4-diaminobutanoate deacetylase DoeB2 n=1 Tax=Vibrio stylophorae TaxID=659351 RepID=UPI001F228117|nr:N(2)-acetyl-L-2,4-diaminobutanoate deacetylase DoeB2 [Vibrio stylophorae]
MLSSPWQELLAFATTIRHQLHQLPELTWQEERTAQLIRQILTDLDIPWRVCATFGTVATLNAQSSNRPHIALRADIDALPIQEQSQVPWQSEHDGVMHACGHDGHTAVLLATAKWLKMHEAELSAPVTLIFQPAEEGGHGAREMIADGALNEIDAIYGWHNWPAIPFAHCVCPDGVVMAGNATFRIILKGKGGHASQPEQCVDPVIAAAALTQNLQQIVSRRIAPQSPTVVSVTSIDANSSYTVIPESATLTGSIRIANMADKLPIERMIRQISIDTAATYGVTAVMDIHPRYRPTVNHPNAAEHARQCWAKLFGQESLNTQTPLPIMASEDFSYYLEKVAGAFALIGANDGVSAHGVDHQHPCHSAFYDFNDRLLERVIAWYAELVGISSPIAPK